MYSTLKDLNFRSQTSKLIMKFIPLEAILNKILYAHFLAKIETNTLILHIKICHPVL